MNVFFVFDDGSLSSAPRTILPGITRDSMFGLARDLGFPVSEDAYTIEQCCADVASGKLTEAFASARGRSSRRLAGAFG